MPIQQDYIDSDDEGLSTEARYALISEVLLRYPHVTFGSEGKRSKAFGSSALKVNGKIFAMIDSKGQFVVKLPPQRVDALIASGQGARFDPGHGRLMKAWLSVEETSETEWLMLAKEAMEFVASEK